MNIRNRRISVPVGAEIVKRENKEYSGNDDIAGNGNMVHDGNINIIQVVDVTENGNMVRIGKYYRK